MFRTIHPLLSGALTFKFVIALDAFIAGPSDRVQPYADWQSASLQIGDRASRTRSHGPHGNNASVLAGLWNRLLHRLGLIKGNYPMMSDQQ